MSSSSSWRNPSTGLETPQVAAPGTSIQMGGCSWPWNTYVASGTSFSAPIVAGIAALMIEKRPALRFWPEAVRAILMATAWNNIEGASSLSSRDGAGGVDARAAYHVTARGNASHRFGTLTPSMFSGSAFYTAQSTYAYAGEKVRAVLAWDSKPDGGPTYSNDNLKADFDLYVYRPTGLVVGLSYSTLNSFEVVEFTAPETGYYTLKIRRRYFTSTSEYFGTAMSRDSDI
jgi:subtilase family serine protease